MKFFLDEKPLAEREQDEGTLEQSLRAAQATIEDAKRILVSFRCDGDEMTGPAMMLALKQPASSFDIIEAFSSTRVDLVLETMQHAADSLEEAETSIQEIAQLLIQGNPGDALPRLGDSLKVWQQVHDAVHKCMTLLEIDAKSTKLGDEPLESALTRPKDVLLQIKNALLAQDHVLLADILQYEFTDVTAMWHSLIERLNQTAKKRQAAD